MLICQHPERSFNWKVQKVAVLGPAVLSKPMGVLLGNAGIRIGCDSPPEIVVFLPDDPVAPPSEVLPPPNSTFNPDSVKHHITTTDDYNHLSDADVIFICAPVPKKVDSYEPDYGPLLDILINITPALKNKPADKVPLLIFESILAPSTMITLIKDHFTNGGLLEGRDLLLGNSPGCSAREPLPLSKKLVAGLQPETPGMIRQIYRHIIDGEQIYLSNSTTAEIISLLDNAGNKVRTAFSLEVAQYCDEHDIDFYAVKRQVDKQLAQSPELSRTAGYELLPPVLEACPPCQIDGDLLLWWRKIDNGADITNSLMLQSRLLRGQVTTQVIELAERRFGNIGGRHIAILGPTDHFIGHDTKNTPIMALILKLLKKDCRISLLAPAGKEGPTKFLQHEKIQYISGSTAEAISRADYIFLGPACKTLLNVMDILTKAPQLKGIIDTCNLYRAADIEALGYQYAGIGKGGRAPDEDFIQFVFNSFIKMEVGLANEIQELISFLNDHYIDDSFNEIHFEEVRELAGSYHSTAFINTAGEEMVDIPEYKGFRSRLVLCSKTSKST